LERRDDRLHKSKQRNNGERGIRISMRQRRLFEAPPTALPVLPFGPALHLNRANQRLPRIVSPGLAFNPVCLHCDGGPIEASGLRTGAARRVPACLCVIPSSVTTATDAASLIGRKRSEGPSSALPQSHSAHTAALSLCQPFAVYVNLSQPDQPLQWQ